MNPPASRQTLEALRRYRDQPEEMPAPIRARATGRLGAPPEVYALADLGPDWRLAADWLAAGPGGVMLLSGDGRQADAFIPFGEIRKVRELAGLSGRMLVFEGDSSPLLSTRFSQRQKRAMENIRVWAEQSLAGRPVAVRDPDSAYREAVAAPIREAQATVARSEMSVIFRLLKYFGPYKKDVAFGVGAAVVMTLLNLFPPWVTRYLLDQVMRPAADGKLAAGELGGIAAAVLGALAASLVIREVCTWIRLRKLAYLGEFVAHDLREQAYAHLQRLSLSFFSKRQTGSLITRVSSDTDRLWEFLAFGVVEASLSVLLLVGLAIMLLGMDLQLGLAMTLPVPLFLAMFRYHGKVIGPRFTKAWRKWSDLTAVLSDTIPGMRVVKAFSQETREKHRFNASNDHALGAFNAVHRSWTSFWPLLMLGFHLVTMAVWTIAVIRVLGLWGAPLTLGTFMAFLLYMGMFLYPLEVIGQVTRMMNRAVSSAHRVFEIMDTEPQVIEVSDPIRLEPLHGRIRFDEVSFSYDGVRPVLRDLNFEIMPGKMIGLVGPSGAGKSTVINLINRFYDVTGGSIHIDGTDIRRLDLATYRRQIGLVQQEPFLFHGRLVDNIRYGRPEATLDEVIAAARTANAHDFICRLPMGYETLVGERGHTLSGGERQRVSIARAILHDPRILILDEATSNVDTETERHIQEALQRVVEGRTVIAIAHRLSTLQRADRLLVFKDGRLAEEGTHAELLAIPDGVYRRLHTLQQELHSQFAV